MMDYPEVGEERQRAGKARDKGTREKLGTHVKGRLRNLMLSLGIDEATLECIGLSTPLKLQH